MGRPMPIAWIRTNGTAAKFFVGGLRDMTAGVGPGSVRGCVDDVCPFEAFEKDPVFEPGEGAGRGGGAGYIVGLVDIAGLRVGLDGKLFMNRGSVRTPFRKFDIDFIFVIEIGIQPQHHVSIDRVDGAIEIEDIPAIAQ